MKRFLQVTAIAALTAFLIWLFLRNADLVEVGKLFRQASPGWLVAAVGINLLTLVFRTIRWRLLLDAENPPPFYATFFANTVGYMLSTVLPIRAADVARPALLSRRTEHRFSGALGTVLMERLLDLTSILLLYVFFVGRHWREFGANPATRHVWNFVIKPSALVAVGILAAVAFFAAGVFFYAGTIRRLHAFLGRVVPARFRDSWMHFFDTFVETMGIVRNGRPFLVVLACTVGVWFCLTMQFIFAVIALHFDLPIDSAFLVTGTTTVGLAIPTPGGIGGLHKICQWVLTTFYGFGVDAAVAAAVLFHLVGTLPVVVVGLVLFAREGLRWKEVTRA